jgi:hypothetical protein
MFLTSAVQQRQHVDAVWCGTCFGGLVSTFMVIYILRIPSGCIRICGARIPPTCTPLAQGLICAVFSSSRATPTKNEYLFTLRNPLKARWSLYVPHSGHYICRTVVTICTAQWSLYVPHSGHYMYRTVVTICTAQWSLYVPHSGHYMYRQFNIHKFYVLPTQCIYVFCLGLRTNIDYFPLQH